MFYATAANSTFADKKIGRRKRAQKLIRVIRASRKVPSHAKESLRPFWDAESGRSSKVYVIAHGSRGNRQKQPTVGNGVKRKLLVYVMVVGDARYAAIVRKKEHWG